MLFQSAQMGGETQPYEFWLTKQVMQKPSVTPMMKQISLSRIMLFTIRFIIITSINNNKDDVGTQYRTLVFITHEKDLVVINQVFVERWLKYTINLAVEKENSWRIVVAEDYHQDYLKKNPNGYCHISMLKRRPILSLMPANIQNQVMRNWKRPCHLEYVVTQENQTELVLSHRYSGINEFPIYVDIATGGNLSFHQNTNLSGCGWPSFTQPISPDVVTYKEDKSYTIWRV